MSKVLIPFNIKYKKDIESGDLEVVRENLTKVDIIYWSKPGDKPIVGIFVPEGKKDGVVEDFKENDERIFIYVEEHKYDIGDRIRYCGNGYEITGLDDWGYKVMAFDLSGWGGWAVGIGYSEDGNIEPYEKPEERGFKFFRKEGWMLNPSDSVVNGIMKSLKRCEGHCPCHNKYAGTDDDICPCRAYREEDVCCCGLYVKAPSSENTPD